MLTTKKGVISWQKTYRNCLNCLVVVGKSHFAIKCDFY